MQNAAEALTKFRDRVLHLLYEKKSAEEALNQQKIKISFHFKKPTLTHYKSYESSNKIDELKTKVYKELVPLASKTKT